MSARGPEGEDKLFLPDPQPERIVLIVRAVCGLLAGLFVAGVSWLKYLSGLGTWPTVLWFAAWGAAFAWLAMRLGDAFWERWISSWFWR